jgi:type II secretory pathway component PulF
MARLSRSIRGATIPERALGLFFHNFARLIGTGHPFPTSLINAAKGIDEELLAICEQVAPKMQNGMPLFQALVPFRSRFPELTIPVLEVAEVSGTLEGASERLSKAFSSFDNFQSRFHDVALDPVKIILGAVMFKVIFAVGLPPIEVLRLALFTAAQVAFLVFLVRMLYRFLHHDRRFHILVDKIRLAIPHSGAIQRNLASARWARSFATMWHAGVPISQALDVASRSSLNAYYEMHIQKAVALTRQGKSLAESLEGIELTPQHLLPILRVAETTAEFGKALDQYVNALEEEALQKAAQESMAAMVTGYIMAGLMAALIAFGVPVPSFLL